MFNMKTKVVLLSLCGVLSLGFGVGLSLKQESNYLEADAATHTANFDPYYYSGNYYNSITATGQGLNGTLRKALTSKIFPKGWYTYGSSGEGHLSSVLQYADEDPTNNKNMIYLYTRDSVTKNPANTWNREHCWPQANSGGYWGKTKAGTDILHIRPTYDTTNNKRGNLPYGNVTGGTKLVYNNMEYGYSGGGHFMPLDSVKGDVARIIMYVWTAYKNEYANLPEITSTFADYDTLLKWHVSDVPDAMEGHRNDYSETSKQENRNPFVDHPEYAWKVFGEKCSSSVVEEAKAKYPDGPSISLDATSKSVEVNKTVTVTATTSDGAKIDWTSDNSNISYTSQTTSGQANTIAGLSVGTTILKAKSQSGPEQTCTITITNHPVTPTIEISDTSKAIKVDSFFNISATTNDGAEISWSSNNDNISFSSSTRSGEANLVTGLKVGTTTLTATSESGPSASCVIEVQEKDPEPIIPEVTLSQKELTIEVDEEVKISALTNDNKTINWGKDNDNITLGMIFTEDGEENTVKGKKVGTSIITVISDSGAKDKCKVTVKEKAPEPPVDPDPEEKKGGCSGSIITTSILVSTLAAIGIVLILIRKRFVK